MSLTKIIKNVSEISDSDSDSDNDSDSDSDSESDSDSDRYNWSVAIDRKENVPPSNNT